LLAETLNAIGYEIIQASEIIQAWQILSQSKVDLVITDLFMPSGKGLEFMLQLKKDRPDIPVIVMTTPGDEISSWEILESGADGILAKPFRINRVEDLIASVFLKFDKASRVTPKSRRKILIVDDDANMIDFMTEALKALGYKVEARHDSTSALEAFKKYKFDLVISDFMLPDGTGLELLKSIKKLKPMMQVVIATGYPLAYPPAMARADGVDGYLAKPFRINQLEQVIVTLLYPERIKK